MFCSHSPVQHYADKGKVADQQPIRSLEDGQLEELTELRVRETRRARLRGEILAETLSIMGYVYESVARYTSSYEASPAHLLWQIELEEENDCTTEQGILQAS
ncbi:hypothetical protein N7453_002359 [Penicillium expansum]|nr:hypothetical protein N7453_002359 [Penicillium expansum]